MRRLSGILGRTGLAQVAEKLPALPVRRKAAPDAEPLDDASSSALAARIGEENEGLRSLLVEAGRKIDELDTLKETFGDIVEPIGKVLRELEQEKSHNVSLRNLLGETRAVYEKLRADHHQCEKKRNAAESENERLREDFELARQNVRALEVGHAELSNEIGTKRTRIVDLERQLAAETAQRQSLAEDNSAFREQIAAAGKKIVQFEAELQSTRANLVLSENEKNSVQKSLEQNVGEVSRLSRKLSESDGQLVAARTKIGQLEGALSEIESERKNLENKFEDAIERHRTESHTLATRLESLQSRAATAERLLADVRQNLAARTEEVRDFDRKAMEATIARNSAEKKARQLEGAHEGLERQIAELTQSRATLVERSGLVAKALKTREAALARAEAKIATLTERVNALDAELDATRSADEKRLDELNSALSRERMERALAEGALEGSRKDFARAQRELSTKNAMQRHKGARSLVPVSADAIANADLPPDAQAATDAAKGKNGRRPPSNVEPIVKS